MFLSWHWKWKLYPRIHKACSMGKSCGHCYCYIIMVKLSFFPCDLPKHTTAMSQTQVNHQFKFKNVTFTVWHVGQASTKPTLTLRIAQKEALTHCLKCCARRWRIFSWLTALGKNSVLICYNLNLQVLFQSRL